MRDTNRIAAAVFRLVAQLQYIRAEVPEMAAKSEQGGKTSGGGSSKKRSGGSGGGSSTSASTSSGSGSSGGSSSRGGSRSGGSNSGGGSSSSSGSGNNSAANVLRSVVGAAGGSDGLIDLVERLGLVDIVLGRVKSRIEETDVDEVLEDVTEYLRRNPEVLVVSLGAVT
ncbi:MAG TPA: hypothetical protein VF911_17495, partial [Thermoanaerobaculia bacterium]